MLVVRGSIVYILGLIISLQGVLSAQIPYSIKNEDWLDNLRWGFTIQLDLPQKQCNLDVQLSRYLTAKNFVEITDNIEGELIEQATEKEMETCHYIGKISGIPDSWVAISTCEEIEGVIYDGLGIYSITNRSLGNSFGKTEMTLVDSEGNIEINFACGGDNNEYLPLDTETNETCSRSKREDLSESSKYFIEMALVVDRSISNVFRRRGKQIRVHYKNVINVVNAFYQKFNLFVSVVIFDHLVHRGYHDHFKMFADYASSLLIREHVDYVQLVTNSMIVMEMKDGSSKAMEAVVNLGGMCTDINSYGIIKDSWNLQWTASQISLQIARCLGVSSNEIEDECFSRTHSNCSFEAINEVLENNSSLFCLSNEPMAELLIQKSDESALLNVFLPASYVIVAGVLVILLFVSCLFTNIWNKALLCLRCLARIPPMGGPAPPANQAPPQVAVNHTDQAQHQPRNWFMLRNFGINNYARRND